MKNLSAFRCLLPLTTVLLALMAAPAPAQEKIFLHGFESPITLKLATFNTRFSWNGSIIDNRYVANPDNVTANINKFNELKLDLAGMQEVHDYQALQNLGSGTGMNLAAARTDVHFIFPTAVLSSLEIVSQTTHNVGYQLIETGVRFPDGTLVYVFSIHVSWDRPQRVHADVVSEIMRRRTGSHPVLVFGDMNGTTSRLISQSRGALQLIYNVGIDAILGTAHFSRIGDGENHGNLGFSDHPLVVANVKFTPGSDTQAAVPSLAHVMAPGETWFPGPELVPDTSVLTGIRITRLPSNAVFKVGETPLVEGQIVPADQIHDLNYWAVPGNIGKDYWTFEIVEKSEPRVSVPRWVDVFAQEKVSNIRFHRYTAIHPDSDFGWGHANLAYANVGEFIYPDDDRNSPNNDVFNENLPEELQGMLFVQNGGRNESGWSKEYMYFDLPEPTQIYIALGHRGDGAQREKPGWTEQWDSVSFNAGNDRPYDIFTRCLAAGEVMLWGNGTAYHHRYVEENQVVFIGGSCESPEPACESIGKGAEWAREARDCGREDCSDGYWRSWDDKEWCRTFMVNENENWTIAADYGLANFHFYTDWGKGDNNDCGDGETTIRIPFCGFETTVIRGGEEQQHTCNVAGAPDSTITIEKDHGECEYAIIANPWFD